MKKTKEIIGLPIISIFDGTEIGMVRNIIINAEDRSISFIVVENGLHLLGAKVIATDRLLGIGEHAVTVEDENVISMISKIPAAMDLLEKNVQIRGSKVLTKKGRLVGEITEIYVDEEDRCRIRGMEFLPLRGDGSGKFLPDKCIVTYGRHLVIIVDAYEPMLIDIPDLATRQYGGRKAEDAFQQYETDTALPEDVLTDSFAASRSSGVETQGAAFTVKTAPAASISQPQPSVGATVIGSVPQPSVGATVIGSVPQQSAEKKSPDGITDSTSLPVLGMPSARTPEPAGMTPGLIDAAQGTDGVPGGWTEITPATSGALPIVKNLLPDQTDILQAQEGAGSAQVITAGGATSESVMASAPADMPVTGGIPIVAGIPVTGGIPVSAGIPVSSDISATGEIPVFNATQDLDHMPISAVDTLTRAPAGIETSTSIIGETSIFGEPSAPTITPIPGLDSISVETAPVMPPKIIPEQTIYSPVLGETLQPDGSPPVSVYQPSAGAAPLSGTVPNEYGAYTQDKSDMIDAAQPLLPHGTAAPIISPAFVGAAETTPASVRDVTSAADKLAGADVSDAIAATAEDEAPAEAETPPDAVTTPGLESMADLGRGTDTIYADTAVSGPLAADQAELMDASPVSGTTADTVVTARIAEPSQVTGAPFGETILVRDDARITDAMPTDVKPVIDTFEAVADSSAATPVTVETGMEEELSAADAVISDAARGEHGLPIIFTEESSEAPLEASQQEGAAPGASELKNGVYTASQQESVIPDALWTDSSAYTAAGVAEDIAIKNAAAQADAIESEATLFEQRQRKYLTGRIVTKTILDSKGNVLVEEGVRITEAVIDIVKAGGRMVQLVMNNRS